MQALKKTVGSCFWRVFLEQATKKNPAGAYVCRCFLCLKWEKKEEGTVGIAIYIWITYLYVKHRLAGRSVAFNAGQDSQP